MLVRRHAGREQRDLIAVLQQRGLWQTNGRASGITFNHRQRIVEEPAEALKRSAAALRSGRRRTRPRNARRFQLRAFARSICRAMFAT